MFENDGENEYFEEVLATMAIYESFYNAIINKKKQILKSIDIGSRFQTHIKDIIEKWNKVTEALSQNQIFLDTIIRNTRPSFNPFHILKNKDAKIWMKIDNLNRLFKEITRDWSSEGKEERKVYLIILKALIQNNRKGSRILVPGTGAARLSFEIAKLGYVTEGNEFSFFMILFSYFVLNRQCLISNMKLCPYLFPFSNTLCFENQIRKIEILDGELDEVSNILPNFSISTGEFLETYANQQSIFDSVVTCFFLDTAKNVFDYIALIYKILRKEGIWINFGPLQWHWEGNTNEISIELSLDILFNIVKDTGFLLLSKDLIRTTYAHNYKSMSQSSYLCSFTIWKKL